MIAVFKLKLLSLMDTLMSARPCPATTSAIAPPPISVVLFTVLFENELLSISKTHDRGVALELALLLLLLLLLLILSLLLLLLLH